MEEILSHFHRGTVLSVALIILLCFLVPIGFFETINFGNSADGLGLVFGNQTSTAQTAQTMGALMFSFFELVPLVMIFLGERPSALIWALCIFLGYGPDFATNYASLTVTPAVWVGHEGAVAPAVSAIGRVVTSAAMMMMEPIIALDLSLVAKTLFALKPNWKWLKPTEHPGLPPARHAGTSSEPGLFERLSGGLSGLLSKIKLPFVKGDEGDYGEKEELLPQNDGESRREYFRRISEAAHPS